MPRKCSICSHKERDTIDRFLLDNRSFRNIAKQYDLSPTALLRHKQGHIHPLLGKSKEAREITRAENLLEEIKRLRNGARRILEKAERAEDYRAALAGIRELTRIVELLARLQGALGERPVSIIVTPQWISLRTRILEVLEPYPEARLRLSEVLEHESRNEQGSSVCS